MPDQTMVPIEHARKLGVKSDACFLHEQHRPRSVVSRSILSQGPVRVSEMPHVGTIRPPILCVYWLKRGRDEEVDSTSRPIILREWGRNRWNQ